MISQGGKPRLYLHIGAHRTATTAIQACMKANWGRLLDRGILYPFGVERHIGLMNDIFRGARDVREAGADILERVRYHEKDRGVRVHSVLLSDEDVAMRSDLSPLAAFSEFFDVHTIYGLRRQDLWLESWWAQNVKGQWDRALCHVPFEDFMRDRAQFHWIDYDAYLGHQESLFGKQNVIPYVFEKGQMPHGPIEAFCRQIGIMDFDQFRVAGGANISLTPEMSEFVRNLPLIEADMGLRLSLINCAEHVNAMIAKENPPTLLIEHDRRQEIMAGYAAGNRRVARDYFGRDELFLDPLPPASAPIAQPRLPEDPAVLMQRLVYPFMLEVIRRQQQ